MRLLVCLCFFVLFTSVNSAAAGKIKNSEELPNISADVLPSEVHASNGDDQDFNRFTLRNCECQCAGKAVRDKNSGQEYGNCNTNDDTGAAWCYIEIGTNCHDAKPSNEPGYLMSNEACTTPNIGNPLCKKRKSVLPFPPFYAGDTKNGNDTADIIPDLNKRNLASVDTADSDDAINRVHPMNCDCQCVGESKFDDSGRPEGNCEVGDETRKLWCFVKKVPNKHFWGTYVPCTDAKELPYFKHEDRVWKMKYDKSYTACRMPPPNSPYCKPGTGLTRTGFSADTLPSSSNTEHASSDIMERQHKRNCNCQCAAYSVDDDAGNPYGDCETSDDSGKKWCYVPKVHKTHKNRCVDARDSDDELFDKSYSACNNPKKGSVTCQKSKNRGLPTNVDEPLNGGISKGNKKHVAVDITMHFKNHMSGNGDVSTALGTDPFGPDSDGSQ